MDNGNLSSRGWPAPAKLNLFLHVIGRLANGYHALQTLFQFTDFADLMEFTVRRDGILRISPDLPGIPPQENIIIRAAAALRERSGCEFGASITLEKRIPVGGGLGGGSSDAATTLVALNCLWRLGYPPDVLAEIGLEIGADVPVFVYGNTAWGEGVGDKLTPVSTVPCWYLIIDPGCPVATVEIFSAPDLTRNTPAITIRDFLASGGHNDCEPVVRRRYPQVARALDWLGRYADARLTGTGSCIFAGFDDREQAQAVCREVPEGWRGIVTRGVNHSSLLARLARERDAVSRHGLKGSDIGV